MNAEEAERWISTITPKSKCSFCGMVDPIPQEEPFLDELGVSHQVHADCPSGKPFPIIYQPALHGLEARFMGALKSLVDYHNHLREVLPYVYLACDQTIQCPMCNAIWWDVPEDIDQDWHAPGCGIHQALVAVGLATNERKRSPEEPSGPYTPNAPNPDTRTPAQVHRDTVLEGFFAQMARLQWETPPEGVSQEAWVKSVRGMLDKLLDFNPPARGAYSKC